jgi:hypothetical protein
MPNQEMQSICKSGSSVLPPVSLEKLRRHFHETYKLNASQVEIMMVSSSKSLNQAFDNIEKHLKTEEDDQVLSSVFHNLKGVLFNMGEKEWAEFFRDIESKIVAEKKCDFQVVSEMMTGGLMDVLSYDSENG